MPPEKNRILKTAEKFRKNSKNKSGKSGTTRFGSGVLGIFEFMNTNFVVRIFRRSWRYQFFETKPMGITEKNYELNFAKHGVDFGWKSGPGQFLTRVSSSQNCQIWVSEKNRARGPFYETGSFEADHSDVWIHDAPRKESDTKTTEKIRTNLHVLMEYV